MPKPNPRQIFLDVIAKKIVHQKWSGSSHEAFKNLANSSKGDAGEEFFEEYAKSLGFDVESHPSRLGDWDVKIGGSTYEVKLATEDISGSFQFNHIRYDSKYDFLICIGVTPDNLEFGIWTKGEVAEGNAGTLVSMGKNQNSSFKLTKKSGSLEKISCLEKELKRVIKTKSRQNAAVAKKAVAKKAVVKSSRSAKKVASKNTKRKSSAS